MDIASSIHTLLSSAGTHEKHNSKGKLENLKDTESSKEYKKVAEEMESLFAYQLLKTMRETAGTLTEDKKSTGHATYMSMFDVEISKLFAKRGMGLQDAILNWLERMPVSTGSDKNILKND